MLLSWFDIILIHQYTFLDNEGFRYFKAIQPLFHLTRHTKQTVRITGLIWCYMAVGQMIIGIPGSVAILNKCFTYLFPRYSVFVTSVVVITIHWSISVVPACYHTDGTTGNISSRQFVREWILLQRLNGDLHNGLLESIYRTQRGGIHCNNWPLPVDEYLCTFNIIKHYMLHLST